MSGRGDSPPTPGASPATQPDESADSAWGGLGGIPQGPSPMPPTQIVGEPPMKYRVLGLKTRVKSAPHLPNIQEAEGETPNSQDVPATPDTGSGVANPELLAPSSPLLEIDYGDDFPDERNPFKQLQKQRQIQLQI